MDRGTVQKTRRGLQDYAKFLRQKVAGIDEDDKATVLGSPIGRAGLESELAAEMIPYDPERLLAIADRELAWCQEQMIAASRDLGYGDDWKKALEHVKQQFVPPGGQPALIRQLSDEAIQFVEARDLVTIPPLAKETWRMEMMTPQRQRVNAVFHRRRYDQRLISDKRDVARREADDAAGKQSLLRPRDRLSRADSRPSLAGIHDRALSHAPPPVRNAVLDRRLGARIGRCRCGT